jgi:hypothetical protein
MDVSITNITTIPFTNQMVSGEAFFEENFYAGGGYDSFLSLFHVDFSFEQYSHDSPSGGLHSSDYNTGTWSIDGSGNLIINIAGQGTVAVMLVADSATETEVVVDDGTGAPYIVTLEKIVPVDPSLLPGTYMGSDGYTWVINANGTGSVSIYGGISFTWSVDSNGVLRMPGSTGYAAWFFARATSQSTATEYTILKAAFPEHHTSTGNFFDYYGGYTLTRQ